MTLASVQSSGSGWAPLWWRNAVLGPDQLRQRMAFALSEIFVISAAADGATGGSVNQASYYDVLVNNALGNYRQLLEKVTLQPEMGLYLNLWKNDKPNPATGVHADQNYAREVMQLFSVGLVKLNLDGSVQKDGSGNPIAAYGQPEVEAMANTLTGWASKPAGHSGDQAWQYDQDYVNPMVSYDSHHDTSAKTLIGGVTVPAGGTTVADLKIALDALFNHPNVGPFIGKQLIQRLVTSNPSPGYIQRVAAVFNNNGAGVRGDLLAVARAILTDAEAASPGGGGYGKLREPILRMTHLWRAFNAADSSGAIGEYGIVNNAINLFAEQPLEAPSVFNFFVPDYLRAGPLSNAGLVAPEFQITNENTAVLAANQIQRQAYQFVDSSGKKYFSPYGYDETGTLGSSSVLLKTSAWEAYAADPAGLVDQLNLVFMQGAMPSAMKSSLINYVAAIPSSDPSYRAFRAVEAAELIINSPQYAVQR